MRLYTHRQKLIAIGESLKYLDKISDGELLERILKLIGKAQRVFAISLVAIILM
ncbi:MAG: hypothetical protein ACM3X9_00660 [Bacillota bacterium]